MPPPSRMPVSAARKPKPASPIAISELAELSDEEWSASNVAVRMLATRQRPPSAASPTASRHTVERPLPAAGVRMVPR